jgi:tRNA-dihydrouridine synthase 3
LQVADPADADVNGGAAAPASTKLSKRKQAEQRAASRAAQLCFGFLAGACRFEAATCRFSHDAAAYLATKPPDLPGTCPFLSTGKCPYGLSCRYALSHVPLEPALGEHLAAGDGTTTAVVDPDLAPLPVVTFVLAEHNSIPGDVQAALRRNTRPFPAADARLQELGCKISFPAVRTDAGEEHVPKRARVEDDTKSQVAGSRLRRDEIQLVDFSGKSVLAPLTTVGNLPFRRLCKALGADVTVSEMAMATNLLQGQASEWALVRRHPCEDLFGVQLCGGYPDAVARCAEVFADLELSCDFVDLNCGCPIDLVCDKGGGSVLLTKPQRMENICRAAAPLLHVPLTLKTRTGFTDDEALRNAHEIAPKLASWGVTALTLHGRTRGQRYTRTADWDYIKRVSDALRSGDGGESKAPVQLIGNGDVASWTEFREHSAGHGVDTCMVARGALIKPWVFTEIKEQRHWDISAPERLDLLRTFCSHGLEHWGSDARGVENTRRFLLEWLSFTHRYIPVGLLERLPQHMTWRPPGPFCGRSDLETLMASPAPGDWVKLTSMLLGTPPPTFRFVPKHKSNAWANSESGAAQYDAETNG